jgi:hypothetical protein
MEYLLIRYSFTLEDGSGEIFDLRLDPQSIELLGSTTERTPSWARLNFHQCPHCTLKVQEHPYCPLATNLVNIVKRFDTLLSYDQLHVEVETAERHISQDTTAQTGISSLMGLVIAASGCPHTAFFKPMARFHLPLANEEETIYRATSMYLLAQYFMKKEGEKADLELEGLRDICENIHTVNTAIAERLRAASEKDSALNAIVLLDMFALTVPLVIEDSLEDIRYLFESYFRRTRES